MLINADNQVLKADEHTPIEGLFAVGNVSGCFYGGVDYPMDVLGLSIGRAITGGYLAGKHVAALESASGRPSGFVPLPRDAFRVAALAGCAACTHMFSPSPWRRPASGGPSLSYDIESRRVRTEGGKAAILAVDHFDTGGICYDRIAKCAAG